MSKILFHFITLSLLCLHSFADECKDSLHNSSSVKNREAVVIVDGYSSGRLYPEAIRTYAGQNGFEPFIIHVHSVGAPTKEFTATWHPERFDFDIPNRNVHETAAIIQSVLREKGATLKGIITGSEGDGVMLSAELSQILGKDHNIPVGNVEPGLRNKQLMGDQVRAAGINSIPQLMSNDAEEIIQWVRENQFLEKDGKVVIKLVESACSEGLNICTSEDQIRNAVRNSIGKRNEFGVINTHVLAQKFIAGDEYAVNVVTAVNPSTGEPHVVNTDIWKYNKRSSDRGSELIYWYDELVLPNDPVVQPLYNYAKEVLEAFHLRTGSAHAEIKMVPGLGPVLIEVGARAMGAQQPAFVKHIVGQSQIELGILSLWNPTQYSAEPVTYKPQYESAIVYTMKTKNPSSIYAANAAKIIESVPGFYKHRFFHGATAPLPETVDLNTAILDVWLVGDKETVQAGFNRLQEIEEKGLIESYETLGLRLRRHVSRFLQSLLSRP